MAIPPLKMNKADVETAICRTLKKISNNCSLTMLCLFLQWTQMVIVLFFFKENLKEKENTEFAVVRNCGISTI